MTAVKVGDKVRVTKTALITTTTSNPEGGWFKFAGEDFYRYDCDYDTVEVLEVLERSKIGDTVEGQHAFFALPLGAVVRSNFGILVKQTPETWVGTEPTIANPWSARTLVYLPE